jgi:cobalamin biosynthetic protein CobC
MGAAVELAAFRRHGGRLAAARAAFPHAPEPWLDLSTGINPRPYPARSPSPRERARLPDPEALRKLEAAAAAFFGAPAERVAAVPGSEAAIRLLPYLLGAQSVAVAPDTYGGHAESWRAAGAAIHAEPDRAEAWVVVNPNNPDGLITPRQSLLAAANERWTIVDEAFAETAPGISVAAQAQGRLVVLRSFGKFFGLAGLRLGFIVGDPELIARVRQRLGDWPVGADALAGGLAAYANADWIARTRARLACDSARLKAILTSAGLRPVGGTDLFRLVEAPDAHALFQRLAAAGVLCRPFDHPHRLRFGLPGRAQDFRRLAAALSGDAP